MSTIRKDEHGLYVIAGSKLYRPQVPNHIVQRRIKAQRDTDSKCEITSEINARVVGSSDICRITGEGIAENWYAHPHCDSGRFNRNWPNLVKNSEKFFSPVLEKVR